MHACSHIQRRTVRLVVSLVCCLSVSQAATWTVNTSEDMHDKIIGDGICGDPTVPGTTCSIRAALEESNANAEADTVIVPSTVSPLWLRFGEINLSGDRTMLKATGGATIIDGVNQPSRSVMLRVTARQNHISGLTFQRARMHAIVIESDSNVVSGNTLLGAGIDDLSAYGLFLSGTDAAYNRIEANSIGMRATDGVVIANAHGIGISDGAHHNTIGGASKSARNVISGNRGNGITITDEAHRNVIMGNLIGPDLSGVAGPGNGGNGLLLSKGAAWNQIGGITIAERNYICGNASDGVRMLDVGTSQNLLLGNSIGMDVTGYVAFGNRGLGVAISDGAMLNQIGSSDSGSTNIITGNLSHGISITGAGTNENVIRGNYIGFDSSGYGFIGNGEDFSAGIYLGEGTMRTQIGGAGPYDGNYFALNLLGGIYLDGSDQNIIQGNFIGVSLYSLSSGYNGNGVVMRHGASDNLIGGSEPGEGNTISGNQMDVFPFGAGLFIGEPGTDRNVVAGNMIGVDMSGSRRMPNAGAGVVICEGARHNRIGGTLPGERNIISGNGLYSNLVSVGRGVHLYGTGTSYNTITGNLIGVAGDSITPIRNLGNGVGLYFGAANNVIGGDSEVAGNIISGNRSHGIHLQSPDTDRNMIRYNKIFDNDSLGIAIRQSSQHGLTPPTLNSFISGSVRGSSGVAGAIIDIYLADPDPSNMGEGSLWMTSGIADSLGEFDIVLSPQPFGAAVTATQTDSTGTTSAFSPNLPLDQLTDIDDRETLRPTSFMLRQNYPNPFNPTTTISYTLPRTLRVRLSIYNVLGEEVVTLVDGVRAIGEHQVVWDGRSFSGSQVASGMYWYRLQASDFNAQRKMLLLR